MKLQIGCGAEPSLYKYNEKLIVLAKEYGVPQISYTTNGSLLDFDKIKSGKLKLVEKNFSLDYFLENSTDPEMSRRELFKTGLRRFVAFVLFL